MRQRDRIRHALASSYAQSFGGQVADAENTCF